MRARDVTFHSDDFAREVSEDNSPFCEKPISVYFLLLVVNRASLGP